MLSLDMQERQGILADLYTFMDKDTNFSKADYYENVLCVSERDGTLWQITPVFSFGGLLGSSLIASEYNNGWTMEEFSSWVKQLPENMQPLHGVDYQTMLSEMYTASAETFVDWPTGDVHFDSDMFKDLLRFVKEYGSPMLEYNDFDFDTAESLNDLIKKQAGRFIGVARLFL